jgi:hypothetical protein
VEVVRVQTIVTKFLYSPFYSANIDLSLNAKKKIPSGPFPQARSGIIEIMPDT